MEKRVFRNNAEMMAYIRGKVEKLEPISVRDAKEEKPKKKRKKKDVVQAE